MREIAGNLWSFWCDAACVPTNGEVTVSGRLIMGKGVAKQAVDRFPGLATIWGKGIEEKGNIPQLFSVPDRSSFRFGSLISFPTKHHWRDKSDLRLIELSARLLVEMVDNNTELRIVALPPVGCGAGGLEWVDVKKRLGPLDNRFVVIHLEGAL